MVAVIMDRIVFDSFVGISSGAPGQRTSASQCCHLVEIGKISTKVKSLKDIGYKAPAKNTMRLNEFVEHNRIGNFQSELHSILKTNCRVIIRST